MRREETEANCAVRPIPGGRWPAEHEALAWRVPHGPSSLTLPPPVPGGQATSEVRSSRWEDPRGPVGAATRGAFQLPPRGAVPAPCSGPRKGVEGSTGTRDKDMRHGAVTGRGGETSDPSTQLTGRGDTLATLKGTWGTWGTPFRGGSCDHSVCA